MLWNISFLDFRKANGCGARYTPLKTLLVHPSPLPLREGEERAGEGQGEGEERVGARAKERERETARRACTPERHKSVPAVFESRRQKRSREKGKEEERAEQAYTTCGETAMRKENKKK